MDLIPWKTFVIVTNCNVFVYGVEVSRFWFCCAFNVGCLGITTLLRSIELPIGCPPEPRPRESGCFPSRSHTDGRAVVDEAIVAVAGVADDVTTVVIDVVVVANDELVDCLEIYHPDPPSFVACAYVQDFWLAKLKCQAYPLGIAFLWV